MSLSSYRSTVNRLQKEIADLQNVPLHDRATIDISVGRAWCHWLKENGHMRDFEPYIHSYPDSRGDQLVNSYPNELLGTFHDWLEDTYIPGKFPEYIRRLVTPEECKLISEAIGHEIKPVQRRLKAGQTSR